MPAISDRPIPVTTGSPRARSARLEVCHANLAQFPSQLRLARHIHERAIVAVTLTGLFDIGFGSKTLTTRRGWAHVEPATEPHGNTFAASGATVVALEIDPAGMPELLRPVARLLDTPWSGLSSGAEMAARSLAREIRHPDDLSALSMEGLVLEVLASVARVFAAPEDRAPPPWLLEARDMIHDLFARPPRIGDIAKAVGVHPMRLMRAFQAQYGTSPGSYLRRLRLEWALERLAGSDEPVSAIAAGAGYADQSHLTRAVKRGTGYTPGRYRAIRRRSPSSEI
jgi:AraC family transcriptional regulator